MQIRTRVTDSGGTCVEVIDPSDGAVVRCETVTEGEQFVVTVPGATSPADLQLGECEAIPEPEAEAAEAGDAGNGNAISGSGEGDGEDAGQGEQPGEAAEGAEDPAGEDGEQSAA